MPIQMCPIEIPDGYEFVRWGRCEQNDPFIDGTGKLVVWPKRDRTACDYIILRKIEPVPRYIPFTAETFRPHRDRWVRWKDTKVEFHISWCHEHRFGIENSNFDFALVWNQLEFVNQDGTTEPFGQKVEGQHDQDNAE